MTAFGFVVGILRMRVRLVLATLIGGGFGEARTSEPASAISLT